jgi:hypothetical protein
MNRAGKAGDHLIFEKVLPLAILGFGRLRSVRPEMRPTAPCNMDRKHRKMALRNCVLVQLLRFRSELPRPLGSTSVNVHLLIVGRLGLDPST